MNALKKILVVFPVFAVSSVFLYTHYLRQYLHATPKRLLALLAAIALFYLWVAIETKIRKQQSFFDWLLQASFYVYVFSVLTLTGYFILFNQVSGHDWWQSMLQRVNRRQGVNLEPFLFIKRHQLLSYDTVGNFVMLLPLGIYLPLLYKSIRHFLSVTLVAMFVSIAIELMQLATNVRITDINDVILNTAGASVGYLIYCIVHLLFIKPFRSARQQQVFS